MRDRPTFAQLLRRHRVASKLSQEDLAERARVSVKAVSALERGERRAPYRETVALLAEALLLSADEHQLLEDVAASARRRTERAENTAANSPKHNLPPRFTSFVGRDEEVADISALLQSHRLVTVTGAGGVGKTRTAIEVAAGQLTSWEDGVWFVDLGAGRDEHLLLGRIARVLDVRVTDVEDVFAAIATSLKRRRLLLIFDNCEHIIAKTSTVVRELLEISPNLTILATSRERLGLAAEVVYRLQGLATPTFHVSNALDGLTYAAVALFAQRAAAVDNRFVLADDQIDRIAEICRNLDGLALAIELAAAQVPKLGLLTLEDRVRQQVTVLSSDVRDRPERQQTMLSTIAWSYDLLSEAEQQLLRRLAIFEGGWSLEAAESVCADDALEVSTIVGVLSSLVAKSLVVATPVDGRMRYSFLESTRVFARGELFATAECDAVHQRHVNWIAAFADAAGTRYLTAPRSTWLVEAEREVENVRAALFWAMETTGNTANLGTIVGGLGALCRMYGLTAELLQWAETVLARLDFHTYPAIAARLNSTVAQASNGRARIAAAKREIMFLRRLGDRRGIGASLVMLGKGLSETGDSTDALIAIDAAMQIFDAEGWRYELPYARALHERCLILRRQDPSGDVGDDLQEALSIATIFGDDWIALDLRVLLAEVAFDQGDTEEAAQLAHDALGIARAKHWQIQEVTILNCLTVYLLTLGEIDEAERIARDVVSRTYASEPLASFLAIQHLATTAAIRGRYRRAARLCGAVDAWSERERWQRGPTESKGYEMLMNILLSQLPEGAQACFAGEGGCLNKDQLRAEALQA